MNEGTRCSSEARLDVSYYEGLTVVYRLRRAFMFYDHEGVANIVPKGFRTDVASFPWLLKFLPLILMMILGALGFDAWAAFWYAVIAQAFVGFPVHTAYTDAAVAHDWLYSLGRGKFYADWVFLVLIIRRARVLHARFVDGRLNEWPDVLIPPAFVAAWGVLAWRVLRAGVMWLAVSLLGWPAYWKHAIRRHKGMTA